MNRLLAPLALALACAAADDWANLGRLRPGDPITVARFQSGSVAGRYAASTPGEITLTVDGVSQTFPKDSVARVTRNGRPHRIRNGVLLGIVGGLAGAGAFRFGAACAETDDGCRNAQVAAIGGAAAGAAIGAALPARPETLYRMSRKP